MTSISDASAQYPVPDVRVPVEVAVVPVRHGVVPVGAIEAVAEAGGRCWVVGTGTDDALAALGGAVTSAHLAELGPYAPARWAAWLARRLPDDTTVVLPHSPDGRDLAPRLAAALDLPLVSSVVELAPGRAWVARHGGLAMDELELTGPVVATLQIGIGRHPEPPLDAPAPRVERVAVDHDNGSEGHGADAELVAELPADPATMDLAEAPRIIAAGAGLGDRDQIAVLEAVAHALGASVGATRLVTDYGWLPAERQIGTTGVMVQPELYLAVGVSGAVQHTAGLGHPAHVIAVNTDPSCPMMELADLALVCDAPAFLAELARLLDI
ncbi:MAG: mycofactocin-associated electron transfer flavoprotein alpha subunit [Acidimicrobiales bacterium]